MSVDRQVLSPSHRPWATPALNSASLTVWCRSTTRLSSTCQSSLTVYRETSVRVTFVMDIITLAIHPYICLNF